MVIIKTKKPMQQTKVIGSFAIPVMPNKKGRPKSGKGIFKWVKLPSLNANKSK